MGIMNFFLGTASSKDNDAIVEQLAAYLVEGEEVLAGFGLVRDFIAFTNYRYIYVDKQGVTGKRKLMQCVHWRNVLAFEVEGFGHFDLQAVLRLRVKDLEQQVALEFRSSEDLIKAARVVAQLLK